MKHSWGLSEAPGEGGVRRTPTEPTCEAFWAKVEANTAKTEVCRLNELIHRTQNKADSCVHIQHQVPERRVRVAQTWTFLSVLCTAGASGHGVKHAVRSGASRMSS